MDHGCPATLRAAGWFFGVIAGVLLAIAAVLAVPPAVTYMHTGLVPRFPTAVLITGLSIDAALSSVCGLILDTVTAGHREMKRPMYLLDPAPEV